jgi:hypothetical protein
VYIYIGTGLPGKFGGVGTESENYCVILAMLSSMTYSSYSPFGGQPQQGFVQLSPPPSSQQSQHQQQFTQSQLSPQQLSPNQLSPHQLSPQPQHIISQQFAPQSLQQRGVSSDPLSISQHNNSITTTTTSSGVVVLPPIKDMSQSPPQPSRSPLDTLSLAAAAATSPDRRINYTTNSATVVNASSPMSIASLTNPSPILAAAPVAGGAGGQPSGAGARRKRQCSLCHGWFSNLATHRSTHLADNSRPHTCNICGRGFARPNDLFRHQKSHRGDAPFRCPLFVKASLYQNAFGNLEPSCHQNGGFSRCDTYKNHLKAMHFEYPAGTKKRDRGGVAGKCKGCGLNFDNADRWIADHIETGHCDAIKRVQSIHERFA